MRVVPASAVRLRPVVLAALFAPALALGMPGAAPAGGSAKAARELGEAYAQIGKVRAPLFDPASAKTPIAKVGAEVITLGALVDVLAAAHEEHGGAAKGKTDFVPVLDRLIAVKLLAQEAREMGMDELPEIADQVRLFGESFLREAVKANAMKRVKFDPKEAEALYREQIREWRLRSVLFASEEDAKRMRAEVEGGKAFDELLRRAVAEKKAKADDETGFVSLEKLAPPVLEAVGKLAKGAVTLPVKLEKGFAVIRVEDVRHVESADARAWAEATSRERRKTDALHAYYESLLGKYGKADEKLLASLDYDGAAKERFEALRKDARALVTIQGEKALTVADLTAEIEKKFYHGAERAAGEKRVNAQKRAVFESMAFRRLLAKEAKRQGLAATPEYRRAVAEHEEGLLFGTFVQRVIVPDVSVQESAVKAHYEEHEAEYMYPQFYKLDGLAFSDAAAAQAALAKLRAGTDLKWLRQNAAGQLPEPDRKLQLGGTVAASAIPAALGKALAGAKTGDLRLYPAEDGTYVLQVVSETPPAARPYAEVREAIARKLYAEQVEAKVQAYVQKLRGATEVKVFISRIGT